KRWRWPETWRPRRGERSPNSRPPCSTWFRSMTISGTRRPNRTRDTITDHGKPCSSAQSPTAARAFTFVPITPKQGQRYGKHSWPKSSSTSCIKMLTSQIVERILATAPKSTIGLVGDLFLDRYLDIDPALEELSIETRLPAHQVVRVRSHPGALGTVLNN